jgi:hypothetical protein
MRDLRWLITFILELDVASGTGRKSRIAEVDVVKLRKFLEYVSHLTDKSQAQFGSSYLEVDEAQ